MKTLSILLAGTALAITCSTTAQTTTADGYASYGAAITPDGAMNTAAFGQLMGGKETAEVKLKAEIITSCAKKGCWMDVKLQDGSRMKVRFVDYGFFVPTEGLEGKTVIMKGTASKEVITEAMRRHYAEDAGKSKEECEKITGDATELTFLADGVLIR